MRYKGLPLNKAKKAIILIHGRGATAESILSLSSYLNLTDYAIIAPQANGNSWYPFGFMASDEGNKVALESSLGLIEQAFSEILKAGIQADQIMLMGFSQGACLSLEFAARNAQKLGGVVAFTGGLIGEKLNLGNYSGDFQHTPIFIGSSNRDFHVPAKRINESAELLQGMGAEVTVKLFDDPDHTIRAEEINWVNQKFFI
ncbi:phospholipase/carboxylesterase [Algoriphagus boseongensis]|uniref:Phospholipase/carboxylesterase n=1 Tax=Algoriphagus boseongensis TaxID=1442587 RepID=A0A4R6T136_9BACT|nr:dienelactone hydrolase family protein [Algoriphagus boseongensis]TDQ14783.1 phospholipase/carboxylesterase [Algoriphagus boseongensis]